MAAVLNDRDIILQDAPTRLETVYNNNGINIISSASGFNIINGSPSPSTITLSAQFTGQVQGIATYTIEEEQGGGNGITYIDTVTVPGSCIVSYVNMIKDQCTIKATISYMGLTYYDVVTISGKVTKPSAVSSITAIPDTNKIKLSWSKNTELDLAGYEIRASDSGWGDNSYLFRGSTNTALVNPGNLGITTYWYIRAFNTSNLYSNTTISTSYTVQAPSNPGTITESFEDTSLTTSSVTLTWVPASPTFDIKEYQVSYDSVVKTLKANTITLPANWLGSRTFTIKTIDILGNISSGISKAVSKSPPNPASNFRAQVIDNNVLLYWNLPAKTTLPIAHILLKKTTTGQAWADMEVIGTKSGEFTSIQELNAGEYTYGIAVVDTDDNESTPTFMTAQVSQPPDFVFNAQFISTFVTKTYQTVTMSNAEKTSDSTVIIPINLTETFQNHFTTRSWTTPQDQINAGYTYYTQPGTTTGYYQEVFDYQQTLGSSNIIVSIGDKTLVGTISKAVTISISTNGSTWTDFNGLESIFATNFRYVKVRIDITQATSGALYQLISLTVRLDTKLKVDSGNVNAVSTDPNGTIVNFNAEFFDVSAIALAYNGTASRTCVYDFLDSILAATYTITSNVCTMITAGSHNLVAGQRVRCFSASGNLPNGVYTIASVTNSTTYTFNVTAANGSGTSSTYPNSTRVYLFDSSTGTRSTGTVSWTVRGN